AVSFSGKPARALWQAQTTSRALTPLPTPRNPTREPKPRPRAPGCPERRKKNLVGGLRAPCGGQADHLARSHALTHTPARADAEDHQPLITSIYEVRAVGRPDAVNTRPGVGQTKSQRDGPSGCCGASPLSTPAR